MEYYDPNYYTQIGISSTLSFESWEDLFAALEGEVDFLRNVPLPDSGISDSITRKELAKRKLKLGRDRVLTIFRDIAKLKGKVKIEYFGVKGTTHREALLFIQRELGRIICEKVYLSMRALQQYSHSEGLLEVVMEDRTTNILLEGIYYEDEQLLDNSPIIRGVRDISLYHRAKQLINT